MITTPGSKISNTEIFFSGLTLPLLGQHVTYLSMLSLIQGALHPFLFVSTLAEAISNCFTSCMMIYKLYKLLIVDTNKHIVIKYKDI